MRHCRIKIVNGHTLKTRTLHASEPNTNYDRGQGVAVNAQGMVFATGYSQTSLTSGFYLKYDQDGERLCDVTLNLEPTKPTLPRDITVDPNGFPIVVGYGASAQVSQQVYVAKLSP